MGLATWGDGSCAGREEGTEQQHRCIQRGKERGGSIPEVNEKWGVGDLGGVVLSDSGSSSSRRQEVGCDPKLGLLQDSYSLPTPWSLCKPHSSSKKAIWNTFIINQPFFFFSFYFFSTVDTPPPPPVLPSVPTENSVYQDLQPGPATSA